VGIIEIVRALQKVTGNNAKLAILEENKDNLLLQAFFKAMMDPQLNYFQTKIVPAKSAIAGHEEFGMYVIEFLITQLAARAVTGNEAKADLGRMYASLNPDGKELLTYIIKRKLDKTNVGETMVLKTWPGLFFVPPYMRCSSMDAKVVAHYRELRHFYVQPKRDGSFAYGVNEEGSLWLCTRQGNTYPQWFAEHVLEGLGGNAVLVGELEVYQRGEDSHDGINWNLLDRKTGNGILSSIEKGADKASIDFREYMFAYIAWDCLWLEEWKAAKSDEQYGDRLNRVHDIIENMPCVEPIESHEVSSVEEAFDINTALTTQGKEGTVWKTMSGKWRDTSSGTKDMVKLKVVFAADYEIESCYEGEGKAAGVLGGFNVKTRCGKLRSGVGTGFSDAQRKLLWEQRDTLPGVIAELNANDVIDNKDRPGVFALSLPVFVELRWDKKEADTLERVLEQRDAARFGK
jgi:hypothetical protein